VCWGGARTDGDGLVLGAQGAQFLEWHQTVAATVTLQLPCPATGADAYSYSSSTGNSFLLNVSYQAFPAAEQSCKDSGGHLASYESEAEQAEVRHHQRCCGKRLADANGAQVLGPIATMVHKCCGP
jgi:hypothetical protein